MKTLFKTILVAGVVASAIALPVSAGDHSNLRGMYDEQSAVNEFEGRFVQPQSQDISWQQQRLQYAKSSYPVSQHQPQTRRRYNAGETYSRYGSNASQKSSYGNVYDYESGHCGATCAQPVQNYAPQQYYVPRQTYRQITQYKCWNGEVVSTADGCAPRTVTTTVEQYRCWDGEVVIDVNGCKQQTITREVTRQVSSNQAQCPAGTTLQSDGTCLEGGLTGYSSPYTGSSVELFTGTGYISDGSYGATDYPILRK